MSNIQKTMSSTTSFRDGHVKDTGEYECADIHNMRRMGLPQKLQRHLNFLAVFCFASMSGATWEWALVTSQGSLLNGGSGGSIWMFLVVMFGMFTVVLSMAEMASIVPSAAGQYDWVSQLAPVNASRKLSYVVGWFAAIGWQGAAASNPLVIAQHIKAIVAIQNSDFEMQSWMISLLMIGTALLATIVNLYCIRLFRSLEAVMMLLHVLGFFAFILIFCLMGERTDAREVFFSFDDGGGWGSTGTACLVGLVGPIITLIGGDSTVHLGEETKDASRNLPLSMVSASLLNYFVGFGMLITVLFVSGNFDQTIATQTGESYVAIVLAATRSRTATTILTAYMMCLFFCTSINTVTTASRQLYAFARDRGTPFSGTLGRVNSGAKVPRNALLATFGATFVLAWIVSASDIAFQNITSITVVGLLLSYWTAVATRLYSRWSGKELPHPAHGFWNYGRALGNIINALALCFITVAFIFAFFPTSPRPDPSSMNWNIVVTFSVLLVAIIHWIVSARKTFSGPGARQGVHEEIEVKDL